MSEAIAEAIAGTTQDLFPEGQTEDPSTEETAPEAEVAETETTDWTAVERDLFTEDEEEAPDFSDEEEVEAQDESLAPTEYDDETTVALKRQVAAARKQAEFYQRQSQKTARKNWEADVKGQAWGQFLPADLSGISASSHRDFIKQTRAIAKASYSVVKPHIEALEAERAKLKATATTVAQSEVQAAWGRPTVGSGAGQVPATQAQQSSDALADARKRRSMVDVTKAMIEGGLF